MATQIRLKRFGRRNRPSFRVVVMDSRKKRDGASIEELGWYDPIREDNNFFLKEDRVIHWLRQGAQPSDTVKSLMKKSGLAYRWHMLRRGVDEKTVDHEFQKWVLDREVREKEQAEERARKAQEKAEAALEEETEAAVEEMTAEEVASEVETEPDVTMDESVGAPEEEEAVPDEEKPGGGENGEVNAEDVEATVEDDSEPTEEKAQDDEGKEIRAETKDRQLQKAKTEPDVKTRQKAGQPKVQKDSSDTEETTESDDGDMPSQAEGASAEGGSPGS